MNSGVLFDRLAAQKPDALLQLIALCNADPRGDKIDVGVGVYKDSAGNTPILRAVKKAEAILHETQQTKSYLGSQGDARFVELIKPIAFGEGAAERCRVGEAHRLAEHAFLLERAHAPPGGCRRGADPFAERGVAQIRVALQVPDDAAVDTVDLKWLFHMCRFSSKSVSKPRVRTATLISISSGGRLM